MTFVNTTLLIALAAVGIPIALHLIARKEPKQVVFPSVRLLTQRFETNRSKVRVRRWWLLALRIAAFAVLALALARPVIAGALSMTWSTIGILSLAGIALLAMASVAAGKANQKNLVWALLGAAGLVLVAALGWAGYTLASGTKPQIDDATPVALAIVVDNAPLSAWRSADETQLNRLRDAAKQLILAANRQSRIAVVDRSSAPAAFSLDVTGAVSKADALQALEVVQPLESRIEAAARLLQTSEIPSRQLVVLSGLAESSFSAEGPDSSMAALLESSDIRVTVWDLGGYVGANRSVSLPTLSDISPAPETSIAVAAVLSLNEVDATPSGTDTEDSTPDRSLNVTAECVLYPSSPALPVVRDGAIIRPQAKPVDRLSVTLQPGRDVELQMTLPPLSVGLHHGAIRLVGEDSLAIDDASYFSVAVLPPSRLLLIGDQADEAEEIAWAVSAPAPIDDPSSQYAIERIGYDDLAASRMTDFDGVILLDPPESALGEPELARYRDQGGSVFVAVGDRLGQGQVAVEGWPVFRRRWRVPDPGTFLEISAVSHPALITLANTPGGVPFQDFRIHQYWQLGPSDQAQVLMRYAGTEHAALVQWASAANGAAADSSGAASAASGAGRILVLTTPIPAIAPPSSAWNRLFQSDEYWPAFSLVRDVTRYVTGRSAESWTTRVGAPVSIPIRNQAATEADGKPRRLQWFPPVGATPVPINLPPADSPQGDLTSRIVVGQPKHSGVHWIRGDEIGLGFTANLQRDQLSTTRLDFERLERLFGPDQLRQIDSLEEMDWTATDGTRVVSLWSPIMLLALLVFMLEQVLGNRFYRRAAAANSGSAVRRSAA
ncbi:BatA domain-containing protein [Rhodopirellula sp. JC639]|uniref:BatA domain-containing protein n=1 Tax=Stieleria mannarensis TaxID=2755585 RepID=UPI0015FFFF96